MLKVRKYYAYGEQYDYFNDRNIIGFTRLGDYEHHDSGLAVVMSDEKGGGIQMNVGTNMIALPLRRICFESCHLFVCLKSFVFILRLMDLFNLYTLII